MRTGMIPTPTRRPWAGGNGGIAPASLLGEFHDEMDRMFQRFFEQPFSAVRQGGGEMIAWAPPLDINETDGQIRIQAEIPGVSAEDIDISVEDDVLTIAGEKKEESERDEQGFHIAERRFGSFRRSVQLPATVDTENVDAQFDDGVLTVTLNKTQAQPRKKIPVKPAKK